MGKGIVWAGLLAGAVLQVAVPAHAGTVCETIVEGTTDVVTLAAASRARAKESVKGIGTIVGAAVGKIISPILCATNPNPNNSGLPKSLCVRGHKPDGSCETEPSFLSCGWGHKPDGSCETKPSFLLMGIGPEL